MMGGGVVKTIGLDSTTVSLFLMIHPFLDELVPVEAREGLGRHNKLVPMGLDVIILRLR